MRKVVKSSERGQLLRLQTPDIAVIRSDCNIITKFRDKPIFALVFYQLFVLIVS